MIFIESFLFNSICNHCNRIAQFVIKKGKRNNYFLLSYSENRPGGFKEIRFHLPGNDLNSFLLTEDDQFQLPSLPEITKT